MATYMKQMQRIVDDYRPSGEPWPTSAKAIADWAIKSGRWEFPVSAIRRRCAEDIAAGMREEYTTDRKGRRVRLLHPAATKADTGEQLVLWDDIRTAPRSHIADSSRQTLIATTTPIPTPSLSRWSLILQWTLPNWRRQTTPLRFCKKQGAAG